MHHPEVIDCSVDEVSVETIEQRYFTVAHNRKSDLLDLLLKREQPEQAIVFCRTKRGTDRLHRQLSHHFDGCGACTATCNNANEIVCCKLFVDRKLKILVATDVVGRGIDISTISHIVNYDIPQDCDDYVHRVGRTGRMGREGIAFTFIVPAKANS